MGVLLSAVLRETGTMTPLLPAVLSTTAGAVDVIGFLALGGLFTAHITGNLVVLAAHYITGGFAEIGPLAAVPVFIVVLGAATVAAVEFEKTRYGSRRPLLFLQAVLLAGCLAVGVGFGPFADADRPIPVVVGMLAVAAMATQNALVRFALPGSPSTAAMTTNIAQLTVDLATVVCVRMSEPEELARARYRASVTFACMVGFLAGCASGAVLVVHFGLWALALPAVLATLAFTLDVLKRDRLTSPRT
jgi:uncharacterized membrane protein YoaK (UPF0700 family)